MQPQSGFAHHDPEPERRPVTLVWVDAREATIVRWLNGSASLEQIESDVPPHHRGGEHIRHDDARHGGSGEPSLGGEPRRLEHLTAFLREVTSHLSRDEDLTVLGPGTVREKLVRRIRVDDRQHHRSRNVVAAPSEELTERQLIARARSHAGEPPKRVGVDEDLPPHHAP